MDLEVAILKYWGKEEMLPIVEYIGSDQERYDQAMKLMLSPNKKVHQKAAWVIQHSSEHYPWLINKHIGAVIKNLFNEGLHDSVKLASLRSLDLIEIPEEYWGEAVEICFQLLMSKDPTGVKMFAMCVLHRISKKLPELNNEFKVVLEDQLPYGTAGFKNKANKILAEIG